MPQDEPQPALTEFAHRTDPLFTNGDFEDGTLNSWTVETYLNPGITYPPASIADLNLQPGGIPLTFARQSATGPATQIPAGLTATDSLRWPRYGNVSTVVNELGNNQNVNTLVQQTQVTSADVDPSDGKVHVRFALAPVLQNPGHTPQEQPYFYVQVRNVTRGQVLWSTFNFANQPGVPWKLNTDGSVQYTEWQAVDVAPGAALLAVGDTVELKVIAAGCQPGRHWGHVYVDGFGSFLPGLSVVASGPQSANAGSNITYTYVARNAGPTTTSNSTVTIQLPPNTTFVSINAPGAVCNRTPGNPDTVTCNLGTLPVNSGTSFQVTVNINSGTTGTIPHLNYDIRADGVPPLIGPPVYTTVTSGATYADLSATLTDGVSAVNWGQAVRYTLAVSNAGPSAAPGSTVTDTFPAQLTGISWTCTATGGATCGAASGTGNISTTADLPVGGKVTYTIDATVVAGTGTGTLRDDASVAPPAGILDSDNTNNSASDTDAIGTVVTLTVNKSGTGTGTVASSPTGINCGPTCNTAQLDVIAGTQVTLTATPAPHSTFTGWSGGCTGTTNPCTVTVAAASTVTATFTLDTYPITTVTNGNGTLTCPTPVGYGQTATCTVTPAPGYVLTSLTDNGTTVTGSVTGNSYTTPPVDQAHTVIATFKKAPGGTCGSTAECASGYCVDGVCCDIACNGQCEACNVAGSVGTCTAITGAPRGGRTACTSDGTACGGTCDGLSRNVCSYPNTTVQCRNASCSGTVATFPATCNGAGSCGPLQTQSCAPYVCGATACRTTCGTDADCATGTFCSGGTCVPGKPPGQPCTTSAQCQSGVCADGFCCNMACNGQCEACDVPGLVGTCSPVTGAPHANRVACATDGTLCGGTCNGQNRAACAFPGGTVQCSGGSCTGGTATLPASCNGAGACSAPRTQDCAPYACGATTCRNTCQSDSDCTTGMRCSGGACVPKEKPNGQQCGTNAECKSGVCTDGVCCNMACNGQCEACDVQGFVGTCSPVAGAPHANRQACTTDGSACGGTCNGTTRNACSYPSAAVQCGTESCSGNSHTPSATCTGSGACGTAQPESCGNYACGPRTCRVGCTVNADCAETAVCVNSQCKPKGEHGGWKVEGSGCSSSGGGLFLPLALLSAAALLRRRRGAALLACALAVILPTAARAQTSDVSRSFIVERFAPQPGTEDVLGVQSAHTGKPMDFNVRLWGSFAEQPLRLVSDVDPSFQRILLDDQTTLTLAGALSLTDWLEVGASIPVVVNQYARPVGFVDTQLDSGVPAVGLSDLRISGKAKLVDSDSFGVAVALPITLPTAPKEAYLGGGYFTVSPTVIGEYRGPGGLRLMGNVGVLLGRQQQFLNLTLGPALSYGVGGKVDLTPTFNLKLLASVVGETGLSHPSFEASPLELLVALRGTFLEHLEVTLGGGPGLTNGYGTPRYRLIGALGWVSKESPPPPVVKQEPPPLTAGNDEAKLVEGSTATIPVLANDKGAPGEELKVTEATSANGGKVEITPDGKLRYTPKPGFSGKDEVTYTVIGKDGRTATAKVFITVEPKPLDALVANNDEAKVQEGSDVTVPVLDNDKGAPGEELKVGQATSANGGTVEITPDGKLHYTPKPGFTGKDEVTYTAVGKDGRMATAIATITVEPKPLEPLIATDDAAKVPEGSEVTVPVLENDKGAPGEPLHITEATSLNGTVEITADGKLRYTPKPGFSGIDELTYQVVGKDGRKATAKVVVTVEPKPVVKIEKEKKRISVPPVFFATAKNNVLPVSLPILDEVARVLKENPDVRKVRIEAHTDNQGGAAYNMGLSDRRAKFVRDYLIKKGIDPKRLVSQGFGQTKPIDSNKTADGRARNRRVEFNILEQ